jgi:hypothetical protein
MGLSRHLLYTTSYPVPPHHVTSLSPHHQVGLPASYRMSVCLRGAHKQHAWNTVVVEGQVLVVDVLHEPGQLYPEEGGEARQYKRIDEFAFSSLTASRHAFTTSSATPAPPPEARRVAA